MGYRVMLAEALPFRQLLMKVLRSAFFLPVACFRIAGGRQRGRVYASAWVRAGIVVVGHGALFRKLGAKVICRL